MTKLRDEEKRKKELAEEMETIDAIGAPGKKGVKEAKKFFKKEEKEKEKIKAIEKELLESSREKIATYNSLLAGLLNKRLQWVEWPSGWTYQVGPTDKGVAMEVKSPDDRLFRAAFKPSGQSLFDLNAIDTYALRAENTIERIDEEKKIIVKL